MAMQSKSSSSLALLTLTLTLHATLVTISLPLIYVLLLWCSSAALFAYISTRPLPIFLVDYTCYKPEEDRKCPYDVCEYFGLLSGKFSPESGDFMRAIYRKSGLGVETYGPPLFFDPNSDAKHRIYLQEVEESMIATISSLLTKADVPASKITHLIVAASAFAPSPSLSSHLVNRLSLPSNVKTLSLSGMGCSAGTVSLDLAAHLLRLTPGYALVVATDSTGAGWYEGNDRHMLVTNCIFRVGAAAALLTSDASRRHSAKAQLVRTLRTHHGADDASYRAAVQQEDDLGILGVHLSRDLIRVAGAALKTHIATLAPRVLPIREIARYLYLVARVYLAGDEKGARAVVPDFTAAFEHMCIHAGGKAVIDAAGRMMRLGEDVVEPARMSLNRFGNTSSSLVFYELAYLEAKGRVREGDRVWMLGFGSGFKACSVVWRALRDSRLESDNPWGDCIHRYPVQIFKS